MVTRAAHILWLRLRAFLHGWKARSAELYIDLLYDAPDRMAWQMYEEWDRQARFHRGQQTLLSARADALSRPATATVYPFKRPGA